MYLDPSSICKFVFLPVLMSKNAMVNFWKKRPSLPTKVWTCIQADSSQPPKGMGESQSCDLLICLYEIISIFIPTLFHMRHKLSYYNVDVAKPSPICQHGQSDQWLQRFPPWWIAPKLWSKSSRSCSSSSAATTGDHELALAPPEAKRTCNCRKSNQKKLKFQCVLHVVWGWQAWRWRWISRPTQLLNDQPLRLVERLWCSLKRSFDRRSIYTNTPRHKSIPIRHADC